MRSTRIACAVALCFCIALVPALAQQRPESDNGGERQKQDRFSLGIILGHPTGLSAKLWLGPSSAVDAAVAWNVPAGRLHLHADYLQHFFDVFDVAPDRLPLYVGIGGDLRIRFEDPGGSDGVRSGVRVPFGVSFLSAELPLDIFAEVVPGMRLYPATTFDIWWGLGARYRF